MVKSPTWQTKAGKNPKGGLNAKGRASAKAQGMDLKAPVKSGDNPRRASFLARMGGISRFMLVVRKYQGANRVASLSLRSFSQSQ